MFDQQRNLAAGCDKLVKLSMAGCHCCLKGDRSCRNFVPFTGKCPHPAGPKWSPFVKPKFLLFGCAEDQLRSLAARTAADMGMSFEYISHKENIWNTGRIVQEAAFVLIWNGWQHYSPHAANICRAKGIPHAFVEWGVLPQREHYLFDPLGFCGDSILNINLAWVTDADRAKLAETRTSLRAKYPPRVPDDKVLLCLQIESDTQTLYYGRYKGMDDLIEQCVAEYGDKLIIRPHPKTTDRRRMDLVERWGVDRVSLVPDFLNDAATRSRVVAMSSTTLYEAAILGIPVDAKGEHPLAHWPAARHDDVLAGLLSLNLRRDAASAADLLRRIESIPFVEAA